MARTAEDVQADIDRLRGNMAKGIRKMRLGNGEEIEFDSYTEMRRRLTDLEAELSGMSRDGFSVGYVTTGRGL